MIDEITKDAENRMQKSVDALGQELLKIRTGRAHPSLLDHLTVPYYGNPTPLKQVANVSVEDSRTLVVTPWEKDMVKPVEKAIMTANLGLNPSTAGTVIRIPMPALTAERRRDLVRIVKQEAENARIAVRNIRRDANSDFKELLKEKEVSEDESRHAEDNMQKLTDTYIAKIEKVLVVKETELMEV